MAAGHGQKTRVTVYFPGIEYNEPLFNNAISLSEHNFSVLLETYMSQTLSARKGSLSVTTASYKDCCTTEIHSFILKINMAPLQEAYSEAFPA